MSGRPIFYCIRTDHGAAPVVEELRPVAMSGKKVSLKINEAIVDFEPSDMYKRPADVANGYMVGINAEKLTTFWNKAVKRQAIQSLNALNKFLIIKEEPAAEGASEKPSATVKNSEPKGAAPHSSLSSHQNSELNDSKDNKDEPTLSSEELARKNENKQREEMPEPKTDTKPSPSDSPSPLEKPSTAECASPSAVPSPSEATVPAGFSILEDTPSIPAQSSHASQEPASNAMPASAESLSSEQPTTAPSSPATEDLFARAIDLDIEFIEILLMKWVSKAFPVDSHVYCNIVSGTYGQSSWSIVLNGLTKEDRATMEAFLERYDDKHEIDLSNEWDENAPDADNWSIVLTTNICNRLAGAEILPALDPPFCYGVDYAIYTGDRVTFISPRPEN